MQPNSKKYGSFDASQAAAEKQFSSHTSELRSTPEVNESLVIRISIIDRALADCVATEPPEETDYDVVTQ
jgi:hypothetical protein